MIRETDSVTIFLKSPVCLNARKEMTRRIKLTPTTFPISSSTFVATYVGCLGNFNLGSLLTNTLLLPRDVERYIIRCTYVYVIIHAQSANYSSLGLRHIKTLLPQLRGREKKDEHSKSVNV